ALLRGLDAAASYRFLKQLSITSKLSLLRAYNRNIDDWLILMPSDRLSNELRYTFTSGKTFREPIIGVEFANIFKQTRVPSDKNGRQDYKAAPDGYNLFNLNASVNIHRGKYPVTAGIGVRNLFNVSYREYLNSFRYYADEAGRNIQIRLKFTL
ncbi:MAG: TonB-dependent receptor, partial [Proteobacteria bacterium]